MANVRHPDPDRVYACPECDGSGGLTRRTRKPRNGASWYACSDCGASFDRPVERRPRSATNGAPVGPQSEIGQALLAADPDDIGGDA